MCETTPADVIFLIDSSGSVGQSNFEIEKQFIYNFTKAIHIGPTKVQVGVVRYSYAPDTVIHLKDSKSESDLRRAIQGMEFRLGASNTDLALSHAYYNGFTTEEWDRPNVPDFLVLLSDGQYFDNQATIAEAEQIHKSNITVYAIGIGTNVNSREMADIATDRNHVFVVPDYNALYTLITDIHPIACKGHICKHIEFVE